MLKFICALLLCCLFFENSNGQNPLPPFINAPASQWADSVLSTMTEEQRIGQLFMVAAFSNRDAAHIAEITDLINKYYIGGLIFFQGGPARQIILTNYYQ